MKKSFLIFQSEMDRTPLTWMRENSGYCEAKIDHVIETLIEYREFGNRVTGIWKITIERVPPPVVATWRKAAKQSREETKGEQNA